MDLPLAPPVLPMEARAEKNMPVREGLLFEPKWDGFRCVAFRDRDEVFLQSKAGQPLGRYFPEVVEALKRMKAERFILDGELVVPVSGCLDFDQLLARIHPAASRVRKLAADFPAQYIIFDILAEGRDPVYERPLKARRSRLERFAQAFSDDPILALSPATDDPQLARRWRQDLGGALDGIIVKDIDAAYAFGERSSVVKIKDFRTADCVVGGYRTDKAGRTIASLLLGLYDAEGELDYVGFTSGFKALEKNRLFERLQQLRATSPFTRRSPGGPSRWNGGASAQWVPVAPEIVIEVAFDHVTNGRFRHGTRLLRLRPDKPPRQCSTDQLKPLRVADANQIVHG